MTIFDLTIAVTAHSETVIAGPAMRSAEAAIAVAESAGFTVERLIGLDSPSDACRAFFTQAEFENWKSVELQVSDLGLSRNALAKVARGQYIAFLDADDLFSENWLSVGATILKEAERRREKLILHPEINWFFDAHASILCNIDQEDPLFSIYYFYIRNYYDSLAMAPRDAFLQIPYVERDKVHGFGFEDWRWNLDTIAAGWFHVTVPHTIIFKRRQDNSLVTELAQKCSLIWDTELMAIDRLKMHGRGSQVQKG